MDGSTTEFSELPNRITITHPEFILGRTADIENCRSNSDQHDKNFEKTPEENIYMDEKKLIDKNTAL